MSQLTGSVITAILPKIIEDGKANIVAQSRFLKEINKARKKHNINAGGIYQPYQVEENNAGFGVAEGGAILQGSTPEYAMTNVGLRAHWASLNWTGSVERTRSAYLTQMQNDPKFNMYGLKDLGKIARNYAVRDLVFSTLKMYARRENFFALQGSSNSAIGVVTSIADAGTNKLYFDPNTTAMGNRVFGKGQQIEFRSTGGVIRNATANFFTVNARVDKRSATGLVDFDDVGADILVDDTAHLRNGYGLMPVGVPEYVDDVDSFKGVARSTNPDVFSSVRIRNVGSPAPAPIHVRELLSLIQSKVGYGIPLELLFWVNKAWLFQWETYVYGQITRQVGAGEVQNADLSIDEFSWGGRRFNLDVDVPPDALYALNMMAWSKIEQTPLQAYEFDSGQLCINVIDGDGNRLDAKQSTIFSEYNWDCDDPRSQGISDGFAFNIDHI